MLRLNANHPSIPKISHRVCNRKLGNHYDSSSIVRYGGIGTKKELVLSVSVKAMEDKGNGSGSMSFSGQSWDPSSEIQVPSDQRPVNEYSSLKEGMLYSWGELGPSQFFLRLGGLWLVTFTVLGVPIAAASFNPSREPLRFVLAAGTGTLFLVSLIVLRIYLGWSYVGDRLLSAVVPYEESGWYDGQMWVKPPEVLARDRLLGSYKVNNKQMLKGQRKSANFFLCISGEASNQDAQTNISWNRSFTGFSIRAVRFCNTSRGFL
ncbi:hypothetical protein EUTSA_v10004607mg [Eutrema salsugineum]|uniref:Uncharacterized protein n=1 Tax=Eutrema salsugineum TaxID=72664 RepID=V4K064_EUTSA|nr:hypothetical protein EUTSA_v10004607mg [Eutrema salsugineum]